MRWILLALLLLTSFAKSQNFEKIILEDGFENHKDLWNVNGNSNIKAKIEKNKLVLTSTSKNEPSYKTLKTAYLGETENFELSANIQFLNGDNHKYFGLVMAANKENSLYTEFLINESGYYIIEHQYSEEHQKAIPHACKKFKKSDKINLRVERKYNCLSFFINNEKVQEDCNYRYFSDYFGFYVNTEQEILVEDFKLIASQKNFPIQAPLTTKIIKEPLSDAVNSKYIELSPVISYDGKSMYFVREGHPENVGENKAQDIWFSELQKDGTWGKALNAGFPLNNPSGNFVISVSPDNNTLTVGNTYKSNGDIEGQGLSTSHLKINGWEVPKKIKIKDLVNINPNVDYFITADSKILLSCIDDTKTFGDKDIFVSFMQEDGSFSKPMNIGNTVNTAGEEFGVNLAADNKTLYFISYGHENYGSADIFVTKRLDDTWSKWSKPLNLGPQINSNSWDGAFTTSAKGDYAYLVSRDGGMDGSSDIFKIKLQEDAKPEPVVLVKGKVLNKKTNEAIAANIIYTDLKTNTTIGKATSNPNDGTYKIVLPMGKLYSFLADKNGYYPVSENLKIDSVKEYTEIERDLYLAPIEVGQTIRLNNIFFESGKYDLLAESMAELDRLVDLLIKNKKLEIVINGHTDNVGNDDYNLKLSQNRVESVMNYLILKGIDKTRLSAKGFGESKPISTNETEEGKANNRRVEFTITK